MQKVSEAWKAAHNERLLPENMIEIKIAVGDPESIADAKAESNDADELANTEKIAEGLILTPTRYFTPELNCWLLGGDGDVYPDAKPTDTGFISEALSGENGTFSDPPVISIRFSRVFEKLIPGITITWAEAYNEFAHRFRVTAYSGTEIVAEAEYSDNRELVSACEFPIARYDRIDITVLAWCQPYHRARISEVFIGMQKSYRKSNIVSYNNNIRISPLGDKLPKYEIEFEIDNSDGSYDTGNPNGMTRYLMERQPVTVRYGMKVGGETESISGGRYYLTEWKSPQNGITATFKARDALEYMRGIYHRGIFNPSGESLYKLAEDVLLDANLPLTGYGEHPWRLDASLKNIKTTAALPMVSRAECLQLIANAGRCVMTVDRTGNIVIEPKKTNVEDYTVSNFNSYAKPEIELSKPLSRAEVDVYSYFAVSESKELYNGIRTITGTETLLVEYAQSAVEVSAQVSGGALVSAVYYTHACELTITANGDVTIIVNGKELDASTSLYSIDTGEDGESEELDNPLITSTETAKAAAEYMVSVLKNRRTFSMDWRADTRLDAGDIIRLENEYASETAYVTELKYSFTGAFRASGEARSTR
jgi:hypothetical protein